MALLLKRELILIFTVFLPTVTRNNSPFNAHALFNTGDNTNALLWPGRRLRHSKGVEAREQSVQLTRC